MIVTLDETKVYLRVDYPDEDVLIQTLITAAEAYLNKATGNTFDSTNSLAKTVCLMLVAEWYINRENAQQLSLASATVLNGLIAQLTMAYRTVPPEAPVGLTGFVEESYVWLRWLANIEPNIAGYNVYRDGQKLNTSLVTRRRINDLEFWVWDEFVPVPPQTPPGVVAYKDNSAQSGQSYSYQVSAVDDLGDESAMSVSVQVVMS